MSIEEIIGSVGNFFAVEDSITLWDLLNAPVIVAIIAAVIGWRINRNLLSAQAKSEAAIENAAITSRLREDETAPDAPEDGQVVRSGLSRIQERNTEPSENPLFSEASSEISKLKQTIDLIARRAPDGRNRRKYKNLPRTDYRVLVVALHDDGNINDNEKDAWLAALNAWNRHKNRRIPISEDEAKIIRRGNRPPTS